MVDERHLVAQSWPVAIHFGPLGGAKGHKRAQKEPWDQVKGCKEAPRRHQGGTKEAPGNDLHIDMGPRAAPYQRLIEEHITVDRSALI